MSSPHAKPRFGSRNTLVLALLIAATIVIGLAVDGRGHGLAQPAISLWVWGIFGFLVWRTPALARSGLLACLVYATLGEIVLSLVWGLYDYRLRNLPLFVPPGHVLLFWLGMTLAPRLPVRLLSAIPGIATVGVLALALCDRDLLSVPLLALYLLCWRFGPSPRLYSTMFALALLMELWGTWIGNWTWRASVPLLDWPTQNPPLAAGAFYCALDLLVLVSTRRRQPVLAAENAGD